MTTPVTKKEEVASGICGTDVPLVAWNLVFRFLDFKELKKVTLVCKTWGELVRSLKVFLNFCGPEPVWNPRRKSHETVKISCQEFESALKKWPRLKHLKISRFHPEFSFFKAEYLKQMDWSCLPNLEAVTFDSEGSCTEFFNLEPIIAGDPEYLISIQGFKCQRRFLERFSTKEITGLNLEIEPYSLQKDPEELCYGIQSRGWSFSVKQRTIHGFDGINNILIQCPLLEQVKLHMDDQDDSIIEQLCEVLRMNNMEVSLNMF